MYKRIVCEYVNTENVKMSEVYREQKVEDLQDILLDFCNSTTDDLRKVTIDYICGWREIYCGRGEIKKLYQKFLYNPTGVEEFLKGG